MIENDIYPELRSDVATILHALGNRRGAELIEYVESTETGHDVLRDQVSMLEQELSEVKADLKESASNASELRRLIGTWAEQLDDLDVDSETRSDLISIVKSMRKSAK